MLRRFIPGYKRLLPCFPIYVARVTNEKQIIRTTNQMTEWQKVNIFSLCGPAMYLHSNVGYAPRLKLYSEHYTDNVSIIWLGVAVKSSANKDAVSKDNLHQDRAKQPTQQTSPGCCTSNKHTRVMATSQQRQNCNWTLIFRGLRINHSKGTICKHQPRRDIRGNGRIGVCSQWALCWENSDFIHFL